MGASMNTERRGVYDPWHGTWDDYPARTERLRRDTPGAAMVLAITGSFAAIAWGLWLVLAP